MSLNLSYARLEELFLWALGAEVDGGMQLLVVSPMLSTSNTSVFMREQLDSKVPSLSGNKNRCLPQSQSLALSRACLVRTEPI